MSIFKGNDIRGIYGAELKDSDAYKIGNAFARFIKSKRIVAGRDNRLSSPALYKSLTEGIVDAGASVIDIGLVDSPALYFASHYFKAPAIMITASHNPPSHNGFYLCSNNGASIYSENGLKEIENIVKSDKIISKVKGKVTKKDIFPQYIKHLFSFVKIKNIKPLKVVIDAGNGMGARVSEEIYKKIPQIQTIKLFFESDGSFPNRGPDTTIEENLEKLRWRVKEEKADLGISFDGDADRVAFVDEKGEIIEGSLIGALLVDCIIKSSKNKRVVYTIGCSQIMRETIIKNKGKGFKERVGHSFVNARMIKEHALFGVEHTGHYFYRDNFCTESPIITSLIISTIISNSKRPISSLVSNYKKYYMTKEISFPTENTSSAMEKIKNVLLLKYPKIDTFDGLFISSENYWFRIRPSQTESKIRLVIEGKNREIVEIVKEELVEMIKKTII